MLSIHDAIAMMFWTGYALIAIGVMRSVAGRLAASFARDPQRAAARRFAYIQRNAWSAIGVAVAGAATVIALDLRVDDLTLYPAAVVIVIGTIYVNNYHLHRAERVIRGPRWNMAGTIRFELFFLLSLIGPIVIAVIGDAATRWGLGAAGIEPPPWQGAVWMLAALFSRYALPLERLIGTRRALTGDVAERYRQWGGDADDPTDLPPLYVFDTHHAQVANAFAMWSPRDGRYICITDYLLGKLTTDEAAAVLMHELAHHRYRHIALYEGMMIGCQVLGTLVLIAIGLANVWMGVLVYMLQLVVIRTPVSRRCELACDRFAAERCGDPHVFGNALRRLHEAAMLPSSFGQHERQTHPSLLARLRAIGAAPDVDETTRLESDAPKKVRIGRPALLLGALLAIAVLVVTSLMTGRPPGVWALVGAFLVMIISPGFIQVWMFRREPGNEFEPVEFERRVDPTKTGSLSQYVGAWLLLLLGALVAVLVMYVSVVHPDRPLDPKLTGLTWAVVALCALVSVSMLVRFSAAQRAAHAALDAETLSQLQRRSMLGRVLSFVGFLVGVFVGTLAGLSGLVLLAIDFEIVPAERNHPENNLTLMSTVCLLIGAVGIALAVWHVRRISHDMNALAALTRVAESQAETEAGAEPATDDGGCVEYVSVCRERR
ncbi:MAG: M48 family metalloprotease [Phycisphaera sp.]|nr:M48 family metalloprotease [Phycisphaera sp.]